MKQPGPGPLDQLEPGTAVAGITGPVLQADGRFSPMRLPIGDPVGVWLDLPDCWITPGFVDAHSHLSWSAFEAADRSDDPAVLIEQVAENQLATLHGGVTAVRDAGGLDPKVQTRLATRPGPRVALSVDILGPADARGERHLRRRVSELAEVGASWIKVAATGGIGAGEKQLEPIFSAAELQTIIGTAAALGLPTMVHAWGGPAIDDAVQFGAASIEHAVQLTADQAERIAAAGTFVVPTVWIYREVRRMVRSGELPAALASAAERAVQAHPIALRHCLTAGVRLAMGTDAGLRQQHGRNLHEAAALIESGVPAEIALTAATAGGRELLRLGRGWVDQDDWVVFAADPASPEVLRDPGRLRLVIQGGRVAQRR